MAKNNTILADYPTVEVQSETRLVLALGDGRMFGVVLPADAGEPTGRAELNIPSLDEAGVPQNAKFVRFI